MDALGSTSRALWVGMAVAGGAALALLAMRGDSGSSTPPPAAAAEAVAVGVRVVAGPSVSSLREGVVTAVSGDRVTVDVRGASLTVDRARVVPLSARAGAVRANEYLLCPLGHGVWQGCRVARASDSSLSVVDIAGRRTDIEPGVALEPGDTMRRAIATELAAQARYRAFDAALRNAGALQRPPGWRPRPGDSIVASVPGRGWFGGVVESVSGDQIALDWNAPDAPNTVPAAEVAPPPRAQQPLPIGQLCLLRPDSGQRWNPCRVEARDGDAYIVTNRAGVETRVTGDRLLPFGNPPPYDDALAERDAPFGATPPRVVDAMLELAEVTADDRVVDLGSGDGRIPIAAATRYGARAVGYEIDPELVAVSQRNAERAGVADLVTIEERDIFDADLSDATVVTLYLSTEVNTRLLPQLRELPAGARVVSHEFTIAGLAPDESISVEVGGPAGGAPTTTLPATAVPAGGAPPAYRARVHLWRAPLVGD